MLAEQEARQLALLASGRVQRIAVEQPRLAGDGCDQEVLEDVVRQLPACVELRPIIRMQRVELALHECGLLLLLGDRGVAQPPVEIADAERMWRQAGDQLGAFQQEAHEHPVVEQVDRIWLVEADIGDPQASAEHRQQQQSTNGLEEGFHNHAPIHSP